MVTDSTLTLISSNKGQCAIGYNVVPFTNRYMKMNDTTNNIDVKEVQPTVIDLATLPIQFEAYDPKAVPSAADGEVIAKVLYKTVEGKEPAGSNSFLRAPEITKGDIEAQADVLLPYIQNYLHSVQEDIVKAAHKIGRTSMERAELDISAVITKLENQGQGRLNKEAVFKWYDKEVATDLQVLFAQQLGLTENSSEAELEKLEVLNTNYRVKFGALAGKSHFMPEQATKLQDVLAATGAIDTVLGARFNIRLETMKKPVVDELVALNL